MLCRDAGSIVQRSRKVATNHHKYVTVWIPVQERQGIPHCAGMLALLCRDRGRSLLIIMSTSLPGRLRRRGNVRPALCKDAGSTVQRSRKVATNHHEYVAAWWPVQERQGTVLHRDAGSIVQRSRKVATNHHEYVTAWIPVQERQGTTLRRDAESIVQRSRKVAINCHEYVTAWMPEQERQGTTLRRDAASTVLRSRKVASNCLEYVVAWTPAQETILRRDAAPTVQRSRKVATKSGMLLLLCRDRGRSLLNLLSTSLPGRLRRRGKVPHCSGKL